MLAEKVSVSLSPTLLRFVEQYQQSHALKSRSRVVEEALNLLRQRELEGAYRAASEEVDAAFEIADRDGLVDEAW